MTDPTRCLYGRPEAECPACQEAKAMMTSSGETNAHHARLGWWVISGERLGELLRRAHDGEDPAALYIEEYANSDHEDVPGGE